MPKAQNKGRPYVSTYTEEQLKQAVEKIRAGELSQRAASRIYNIPQSTLSDHASGRISAGSKPGSKPILSTATEREIVKNVTAAADKGFGVSRLQLMIKAGQVAKKLHLKPAFQNDKAGKDWFYGFKKRNPDISIRKPMKLSTSRAKGMNKKEVVSYFKTLEELQSKVNNDPARIWNMDEKGIQLEHKPTSVVARKGAKVVPGRVSCSRENITIIGCGNAIGTVLPPLIIVKGKTHKSLYAFQTEQGPENSVWTFQEKAWTEDVLGVQWFQLFLQHCGPARPQLLIMDQHKSHEVVDLLVKAEENGIIILGLPPHTSHCLQPLDKGCYGPLQSSYNTICSNYMSLSIQHVVTKAVWPKLFNEAWSTAMSKHNMRKGFKTSGIYPLNIAEIQESSYAPSNAYESNITEPETITEAPENDQLTATAPTFTETIDIGQAFPTLNSEAATAMITPTTTDNVAMDSASYGIGQDVPSTSSSITTMSDETSTAMLAPITTTDNVTMDSASYGIGQDVPSTSSSITTMSAETSTDMLAPITTTEIVTMDSAACNISQDVPTTLSTIIKSGTVSDMEPSDFNVTEYLPENLEIEIVTEKQELAAVQEIFSSQKLVFHNKKPSKLKQELGHRVLTSKEILSLKVKEKNQKEERKKQMEDKKLLSAIKKKERLEKQLQKQKALELQLYQLKEQFNL